MLNNDY